MPQEKSKPSEKVRGNKPPHGGSWVYDEKTEESTLVQEPTKEPEPPRVKKPAK